MTSRRQRPARRSGVAIAGGGADAGRLPTEKRRTPRPSASAGPAMPLRLPRPGVPQAPRPLFHRRNHSRVTYSPKRPGYRLISPGHEVVGGRRPLDVRRQSARRRSRRPHNGGGPAPSGCRRRLPPVLGRPSGARPPRQHRDVTMTHEWLRSTVKTGSRSRWCGSAAILFGVRMVHAYGGGTR